MSHYTTVKLKFADKELLIGALKANGYDPLVHDESKPIHLFGYRGDLRPETADIIIPRWQISRGSNDLGFKFNPETRCWDMIISEFDKGLLSGANRIRTEYVRQTVNKQAQLMGLVVHEVNENGKIKFVLTSPTGQITAEPTSDGNVSVRVNGVLGEGCLQLSQAVEAALGEVQSQQHTAEYYATQAVYYQNQQMLGGQGGYYR